MKAANNIKQETILFFIIVGGLALFSSLQLFLATEVQENASDSDLFKLKARVIQCPSGDIKLVGRKPYTVSAGSA